MCCIWNSFYNHTIWIARCNVHARWQVHERPGYAAICELWWTATRFPSLSPHGYTKLHFSNGVSKKPGCRGNCEITWVGRQTAIESQKNLSHFCMWQQNYVREIETYQSRWWTCLHGALSRRYPWSFYRNPSSVWVGSQPIFKPWWWRNLLEDLAAGTRAGDWLHGWCLALQHATERNGVSGYWTSCPLSWGSSNGKFWCTACCGILWILDSRQEELSGLPKGGLDSHSEFLVEWMGEPGWNGATRSHQLPFSMPRCWWTSPDSFCTSGSETMDDFHSPYECHYHSAILWGGDRIFFWILGPPLSISSFPGHRRIDFPDCDPVRWSRRTQAWWTKDFTLCSDVDLGCKLSSRLWTQNCSNETALGCARKGSKGDAKSWLEPNSSQRGCFAENFGQTLRSNL